MSTRPVFTTFDDWIVAHYGSREAYDKLRAKARERLKAWRLRNRSHAWEMCSDEDATRCVACGLKVTGESIAADVDPPACEKP